MKNFRKIVLTIFLCILIFPSKIFAEKYIRPNNFMDKSGAERVAEIKRFQALSNLTVNGRLDEKTKNVLYNKNIVVRDEIAKAPTSGDWIVINKSKKTLTYYRGNQPMYKFPIAAGTSETPTPSAKGKIANKHKNPAWGGMNGKYKPAAADDPKNPLGERWMGLSLPGYSGYGIHGTIKPHQIGTYASNGCMRMFNYDIETFIFPIAKVGMPVWIGTDSELANWGVKQIVEEKSQEVAPTTPSVTENSGDKYQTSTVEEEYKTEELLDF